MPDTSKVHLSVTNNYGVSGQLLPNMVKNSDGIAGVPLSLEAETLFYCPIILLELAVIT